MIAVYEAMITEWYSVTMMTLNVLGRIEMSDLVMIAMMMSHSMTNRLIITMMSLVTVMMAPLMTLPKVTLTLPLPPQNYSYVINAIMPQSMMLVMLLVMIMALTLPALMMSTITVMVTVGSTLTIDVVMKAMLMNE